DVLNGAFAGRFLGLLTRTLGDFSAALPGLKILTP
ncbi:MAG: hypothetical protein RLZZ15_432, partial [Verrucomicrobiota bacterium]